MNLPLNLNLRLTLFHEPIFTTLQLPISKEESHEEPFPNANDCITLL